MGADGADDGGSEAGLRHVCDCSGSEQPSYFAGIPRHRSRGGDGVPSSTPCAEKADLFVSRGSPQHRQGPREGGGRVEGR